jgi:hypothetical protein
MRILELLGWRVPRTEDMRGWFETHATAVADQYVSLLRQNDVELQRFADLCHEIVQDRDFTFSLDRRLRLYERWLSTGQPCLQALKNGQGEMIGGSIVLPLTQMAYDLFCFDDLDALDIETFHIETRKRTPHQYLLIDMLVIKKELAKGLPAIGFRGVIRHLARFYNPSTRSRAPIVLCSTSNEVLSGLLSKLEFQSIKRKRSPTYITPAYLYRVDLSNLELYSPATREYYANLIEVIRSYGK